MHRARNYQNNTHKTRAQQGWDFLTLLAPGPGVKPAK